MAKQQQTAATAREAEQGLERMMDMGRLASVGQTSANAFTQMQMQMMRGWLDFNGQILEFARHRLQQDVDAGQKLSSCKTMSEMIEVVDGFYRKAFSEYADEAGTLMRMSSSMAAKTLEKAQEESRNLVEQTNGRGEPH